MYKCKNKDFDEIKKQNQNIKTQIYNLNSNFSFEIDFNLFHIKLMIRVRYNLVIHYLSLIFQNLVYLHGEKNLNG